MATKLVFPKTNLSPYRLASFITNECEFPIEPQRIYGYVKSGKIETRRGDLGHYLVTPEASKEFIEWFLDPNRGKKAKTSEATEAATAATEQK